MMASCRYSLHKYIHSILFCRTYHIFLSVRKVSYFHRPDVLYRLDSRIRKLFVRSTNNCSQFTLCPLLVVRKLLNLNVDEIAYTSRCHKIGYFITLCLHLICLLTIQYCFNLNVFMFYVLSIILVQ